MEQVTKKNETVGAGVEKIHTKLKFIKSEKNGALISFVSLNPVNGAMCGVREDSPYPKKIVVVDKELANYILVNVLYDVTLIPMTPIVKSPSTEKVLFIPGYVAIKATPVQFQAHIIESYSKNHVYKLTLQFGNKKIFFNPLNGRKETIKSLPACIALLEKRCDIKNLPVVIDTFRDMANSLLATMKQDMTECSKLRIRGC